MPERQLVYPDYVAEVFEGGDIRLSFNAPGSKFGPVYVVLIAPDAEALVGQLVKALDKSDELLAAEDLARRESGASSAVPSGPSPPDHGKEHA